MGKSGPDGCGTAGMVCAILGAMLLIGLVFDEWWGWPFALLGILVGLWATSYIK